MSNGLSAADEIGVGVLICDDNAAIRELLGVIVTLSLGMQVVGEAEDGDQAIVFAAELQPDVILLDLAMPQRSGLEALPELRRVAPEARIVVFSGLTGSNVAETVLELGASSYLRKGADPDTIAATIAEAAATVPRVAPTG